MLFFPINKRKIIVSVAIGATALVGDKNSENEGDRLVAAVCDNVTHGLVGAFMWMGMIITKPDFPSFYFFLEMSLCGFIASAMDLDHFIAAKSFRLKDAVNLKNRPPMHCTTLVIAIITGIITASCFFKINFTYKLGWILAAAFISHHIRDGKRRGLWLWPFGSTPPIPNFLYIAIEMILPHFFSILMREFFPSSSTIRPYKNIVNV